MRGEVLKGHMDLLLLAALAGEPAHGYGIAQALRRRSGGVLDLPEGTLYPALHRLEKAGYVWSEWSSQTGRRRRVYDLTVAGREALARERGEWGAFAGAIEAVLDQA